MIERATSFTHRLGHQVDLPLLVPSFTSKGFPLFTEKRAKRKYVYSQTTRALDELGGYIKEAFLLSAYDLHHRFYKHPETHFSDTSLVFLDSGGYELNPEFDSSEPKLTPVYDGDLSHDEYVAVLTRLYKKHHDTPLVIANFDWDTRDEPFGVQIRAARAVFERFPSWSRNLILKPPKTIIDVDELVPHIADLRDVDIIGVTEKDLGKSLLDRLKKIARLRSELTKREVSVPIHVWGGLDPVVTPLYFFAGADIFDGVSWLRYAFQRGLAVNRESYSTLQGNIGMFNDHAVFLSLNTNLTYLGGLSNSLRALANSNPPNFDVFEFNREELETAFATMKARIPDLREA